MKPDKTAPRRSVGVADDQDSRHKRKYRMVRINEISSLSRTATGYKVVRLDEGDFVADVSIVRR